MNKYQGTYLLSSEYNSNNNFLNNKCNTLA